MITGHLIVIGAMKAATSTLFEAMRRHPNLIIGRTNAKELRYFNGDGWKGAEAYDAQFREPPAERDVLTLDATPLYSKTQRWPEVPGRIAQLGRPVHLVFILRDPVARAVSHLRHNIIKGREKPDALSKILQPNYLDPSRYSVQIAEYEAAGLGDRILLLDFDAVCADIGAAVGDVCRHAGIPAFEVPRPVRRNVSDKIPAETTAGVDLDALRGALAGEGAKMLARGFEPAGRWSV